MPEQATNSSPIVVEKILVVAASPSSERNLAETLRVAGYRVETASETGVALEVPLADLEVTLLITSYADSQTEHICSTIKSKRPTLSIIVIGPDVWSIKLRLFALGADDYIPTPFDHLELLARVRSLIRRQRLSST